MKLYKITSPEHDFEDGLDPVVAVTSWQGTQADARAKRIQLESVFKDIKPAKRPKVIVEEVDVPTSKGELLNWLNENAV